MITMPDWFVKKVAGYPGGMRMPKLGRYWDANTTVPAHNRWGIRLNEILPFGPKKGDPLTGGDLRYWSGLPYQKGVREGYGSCRCCREVHMTKEARKEHHKAGCGRKLEEAYKVFRRVTECIICLNATKQKTYGLPMCSKECEYEWEYVTTTPQALAYVLDDQGEEEIKK